MRHTPALVAVIVLSLSSPIGMSTAWAADPATAVSAPAAPVTDDTGQADAAGVVKTKTKSNQSNDRAASPAPCKDKAETAAPTEVQKTKTRSNQSND